MAARGYRFAALPGSLRQASYTRAVAATLDELAPDSVAVDVLEMLEDIPPFNQDLPVFGLPTAVGELARAVASAHAVVIVTPEYNRSLPGPLKNALDWLSVAPERPLGRKPVAIQSVSPHPHGGARAQEHLRQVLLGMDALVLNSPEVFVALAAGKVDLACGTMRDPKARDDIALQLGALLELALSCTMQRTDLGPPRADPVPPTFL